MDVYLIASFLSINDKMVAGYLESKEGQQAFAEIEQPYAKSLQDELYDDWIQNTDVELLPKYSKHKPVEVKTIRRIKDAEGKGKEWIVYSATEYRLDKALNVTHRWRPLLGKYPIPEARYESRFGNFGKEERTFAEITSIHTGYSIPYSPKNVDKIRDLGIPIDNKIEYLVETANRISIGVPSYEDFRNGVFEELFHFGRIPTELQRRMWLEKEGGPQSDKQRIEDFKYNMDLQTAGIQQRTPTAEETQKMIQEEIAKATKVNDDEQPTTTTKNKKSRRKKEVVV